jgi:hypothetical protein
MKEDSGVQVRAACHQFFTMYALRINAKSRLRYFRAWEPEEVIGFITEFQPNTKHCGGLMDILRT